MNLIVCAKNCRHQQEGYCSLNRMTQLTNDASGVCGYFETPKKEQTAKVHSTTATPENNRNAGKA